MTFNEWVITEETKSFNKFNDEFEKFLDFLRKYDKIGMEKYVKITTSGYFHVLLDFLKSIQKRDSEEQKKQIKNVLKLIPASVLFGTATFAAPMLGGVAMGAYLAVGLKVIQYIYYPFWLWASKNINSEDPIISKKAKMVISIIPEQWVKILTNESIDHEIQQLLNE